MFLTFASLNRPDLSAKMPDRRLNPLGLRKYKQQFTLMFNKKSDANAAVLRVCRLPRDCKLAFSARWDDSSLNHARTIEIMFRHGVKGTFFYNMAKDAQIKVGKRIITCGSSIGLHTCSHPALNTVCPNRQFYEYMYNRMTLESCLNTPVVTQVLPFCNYTSPREYTQYDIGRIFRAVGILASPEIFYPEFGEKIGYPFGGIAESKPVIPGDREINREDFDEKFKSALNDTAALERHPSISIGMHSWHSDNALKNLESIFKDNANNPEWWYCNHNEYGAYCYETNNIVVCKCVTGRNAVFTVTRFLPEELGAQVPLWFKIEQTQVVSALGAKLHKGMLELPHISQFHLPEVYDMTNSEGHSTKFPFLQTVFRHSQERQWLLELENTGNQPLKNVHVTFRFPPQWPEATIRKNIPVLLAGANKTIQVYQPEADKALRFLYGKTYYAVNVDFNINGKRYRLYTDLFDPEQSTQQRLADVTKIFFPVKKDFNLALVSVPEGAVNISEADLLEVKKCIDPAVGYINTEVCDSTLCSHEEAFAAIFEFVPVKERKIELLTNAAELFLNGKRIVLENGRAIISLSKRINRIIVKDILSRKRFFVFLNDGASINPSVTFKQIILK